MELFKKRYRLPWQIKMALLYIATICTVLPTNTANVDASNKREISKGHITFRILNEEGAASEIAEKASPTDTHEISDLLPAAPQQSEEAISEMQEQSSVDESAAGPRYVYWKTVTAKVTAYSPDAISCGKFANGKTSIGKNAWKRTGVAADPTATPYGTMVSIPGVGLRTVDDTGSAMRNSWRKKGVYHFDLRMTYPYECRKWGVKWLKVDLYRPAR